MRSTLIKRRLKRQWIYLTRMGSGFTEICPSLNKCFPLVISDSMKPGMAIVIVTEGANSSLKASKKPINAALLA